MVSCNSLNTRLKSLLIFALDTLMEHYTKVFGKEYSITPKGKVKSDVKKDPKAQKWMKQEISKQLTLDI